MVYEINLATVSDLELLRELFTECSDWGFLQELKAQFLSAVDLETHRTVLEKLMINNHIKVEHFNVTFSSCDNVDIKHLPIKFLVQ